MGLVGTLIALGMALVDSCYWRSVAERRAKRLAGVEAYRDKVHAAANDRLDACGQDGLTAQMQCDAFLLDRALAYRSDEPLPPPRLEVKTLVVKDGESLLKDGVDPEILSELRDCYDGAGRIHYYANGFRSETPV